MTDDWRNEQGIGSLPFYESKFAFFRVKCSCGTTVWLKWYYTKYMKYFACYGDDVHTDFVENITEQEYIVRKLSENL